MYTASVQIQAGFAGKSTAYARRHAVAETLEDALQQLLFSFDNDVLQAMEQGKLLQDQLTVVFTLNPCVPRAKLMQAWNRAAVALCEVVKVIPEDAVESSEDPGNASQARRSRTGR